MRQGRRYGPSTTVQITPAGPLSSSEAGLDAVLGRLSAAFGLCGLEGGQFQGSQFLEGLFMEGNLGGNVGIGPENFRILTDFSEPQNCFN